MTTSTRNHELVKMASPDADLNALKTRMVKLIGEARALKEKVILFATDCLNKQLCSPTEWFYDVAEHALLLDDFLIGRTKQNSTIGSELEGYIEEQIHTYLLKLDSKIRKMAPDELVYGKHKRQDIGFEYNGRQVWIQVKHGFSWQNFQTILNERQETENKNIKYYLLSLNMYENFNTVKRRLEENHVFDKFQTGIGDWIFLGYQGKVKSNKDWYKDFLENIANYLGLINDYQ